ncbi:MAG: alpha/beta hydrolase, partial [Chitinophagaceae bacterium]
MKLIQRISLGYIRSKFKVLSSLSKKKAAEMAFELFCTPGNRSIKPLSQIFDQGDKLQFSIEGIVVNGWRWKNSSGRKALILHGFESSVGNFEKYIRLLIAKGFEVLAFDAPAHGRSGGKKINAPLYKRTILEINKRYGPIQSFMAHSFGGLAVCLALEEIRPGSACRLVLIAPATETTTAINEFFKFLRIDSSIRPEFDKVIIKRSGKEPEWYS